MKSFRKTKNQRKRILEDIKNQHLESLKTKQEIDQSLILMQEESQRTESRKRRYEAIMIQYDGQLSEGELEKLLQQETTNLQQETTTSQQMSYDSQDDNSSEETNSQKTPPTIETPPTPSFVFTYPE
jgi:hypothetical protein